MEEGRKGALDDVNELETCKKEMEESLSLTHTLSFIIIIFFIFGEWRDNNTPPDADRRPHFSNCGDICRFYNPPPIPQRVMHATRCCQLASPTK